MSRKQLSLPAPRPAKHVPWKPFALVLDPVETIEDKVGGTLISRMINTQYHAQCIMIESRKCILKMMGMI